MREKVVAAWFCHVSGIEVYLAIYRAGISKKLFPISCPLCHSAKITTAEIMNYGINCWAVLSFIRNRVFMLTADHFSLY